MAWNPAHVNLRRPAGRHRARTSLLQLLAGLGLAACSSSELGFVPPPIPFQKSSILAPELTTSCPIRGSRIEALVTKGTGLAYNGVQFGNVGTYTYVLAEATGKVSAIDPCAATVVDLVSSADASGTVSYKFDVIILTPSDAAKSSGTLLYIVNDRTNSSALEALNDGTSNNLFDSTAPFIPTNAVDAVVTGAGAGSAYLMKQGMTIVYSGWQGDRPSSLSGATASITDATKWYAPGMTLPVATENGAPILGVVQDEFIADSPGSVEAPANRLGTYYRRAANTAATLTVRKTPTSVPITVGADMWTYTAGAGVKPGGDASADGFGFVTIDRARVRSAVAHADALDEGSDNGSIYHFNYTATDPKPMGLGFLGVRDLIAFLRYEQVDSMGNANPIAGVVKTTLATGISQSGRFLRDFLWQGFNTDRNFRKVFDGLFPLVGGSGRTYTNYRWSKPGDHSRQHEQHYTPGDQFPFAYSTITDPLTGKTDGLMKKCSEFNTCPKVFQYDSPIEFGGARASLVSTDGAGNDIAIPDNVRLFYAAGTSHGPQQLADNAKSQPDYTVDRIASAAAPSTSPGALNASTALYRALLANLDGWVKGTAEPLASNWPRVADGTMAVPTADPVRSRAIDLPALGLPYSGVYNTLTVNDEGVIPSAPDPAKMYVVHVPVQDKQGNSRAGVKMPDSAVPLASFVGYSIRKSGFVAGEINSLSSSQLAFALNALLRDPSDMRLSVEQLYGTKEAYLLAWNNAVDDLVAARLMLPEDAVEYKRRGLMQADQPNFSTFELPVLIPGGEIIPLEPS